MLSKWWNSKQWRPWSNCFSRRTLIWVCTVCLDLSVQKLRVITVNFANVCVQSLWLHFYRKSTIFLNRSLICFIHIIPVSFCFQVYTVYELHREKTCLWGFRPDPTQSGLYSCRVWLEAWILDLVRRGMHCLCRENKCADHLLSYCTAALFVADLCLHFGIC